MTVTMHLSLLGMDGGHRDVTLLKRVTTRHITSGYHASQFTWYGRWTQRYYTTEESYHVSRNQWLPCISVYLVWTVDTEMLHY